MRSPDCGKSMRSRYFRCSAITLLVTFGCNARNFIQLEREGLVALTIEAAAMEHFLLAGTLLIPGG